jgi:putative lipoic acid-binding regulatory protein
MTDLSEKQVVIEYPCRWNYKAVGKDKFELKREISSAILEHDFEITSSKSSKTGKFISLNVDVLVNSDEQRREIYQTLAGLKCVLQVV